MLTRMQARTRLPHAERHARHNLFEGSLVFDTLSCEVSRQGTDIFSFDDPAVEGDIKVQELLPFLQGLRGDSTMEV